VVQGGVQTAPGGHARRATFNRETMADEEEKPIATHTTTILYKSRTGESKELQIVQQLRDGKSKLDFRDMQILARNIANVLKEDS
jgi:hypothetical protein